LLSVLVSIVATEMGGELRAFSGDYPHNPRVRELVALAANRQRIAAVRREKHARSGPDLSSEAGRRV
jgi:hypothetical protein